MQWQIADCLSDLRFQQEMSHNPPAQPLRKSGLPSSCTGQAPPSLSKAVASNLKSLALRCVFFWALQPGPSSPCTQVHARIVQSQANINKDIREWKKSTDKKRKQTLWLENFLQLRHSALCSSIISSFSANSATWDTPKTPPRVA